MKQLRKLLQTECDYTDFQMQQIRYILLSLASEASKFLILLIFFKHISKTLEMLISIIALLSVRLFMGGIHFKHYLPCLLFTFGIFYSGICILPFYVHLNVAAVLTVLNLCILLNYLTGPVLSSYRIPLTKAQKRSSSIKASTSILLYIIIIFVFQENDYLYTGFWMIVLQTFQLIIAKTIIFTKGNHTHEHFINTDKIN